MKTRLIVAAVIEKNSRVLFGRKHKDVGPYPNTMHIIGGGVENGESLEEALRREIREESCIDVSDLEVFATDEDTEPDKNGTPTRYLFVVYKAKYSSGEPRPGDDIVELEWVKKDDIKKLPLSRVSIRTFKKLGYI